MCLMRQTTEKDPTQGSPVSAYMGRATTKTGQIGLLITSYKRLKKTDRAITPAAEVVCVLAHLAPRGYPHAKQLCYLHAQLSLG